MSTTTNNKDSNNSTPLSTAQGDLASLRRVSHRLASLADAAQFATVAGKLLPRLLQRMGRNRALQQDLNNASSSSELYTIYQQIHQQLTDILSHILARFKNDRPSLPTIALLQGLVSDSDNVKDSWTLRSDVDPFVRNLSWTFLALPSPTRTVTEWAAMLPFLVMLSLSSSRPTAWASLTTQCLIGLTSLDNINDKNNCDPNLLETHLTTTRRLLQKQPEVAGAFWGCLLDFLLYQRTNNASLSPSPTTTTALPPPGLSTAAAASLRTTIVTERVPRAVLHLIAPHGRWALFLGPTTPTPQPVTVNSELNEENNNHNHNNNSNNNDDDFDDGNDTNTITQKRGDARTAALLILGTGHWHTAVADQARQSLKAWMDQLHRRRVATSTSTATTDAGAVGVQILALALGYAQAAASAQTNNGNTNNTTITTDDTVTWSLLEDSRAVTTPEWQRRAMDPHTAAAALAYCAKDWHDHSVHLDANVLPLLATWTLGLAKRYLVSTTLSLSTTASKVRVATAQLLHALTLRLTTATTPAASVVVQDEDTPRALHETACQVLAKITTSSGVGGGSVTTWGSVQDHDYLAVREACYGVVAQLARSPTYCHVCMTHKENRNQNDLATTKLLFTCAAKEEERLQPKAVAALDALLSAYERLYASNDSEADVTTISCPTAAASSTNNPWAAVTPAAASSAVTADLSAPLRPDGEALARSLLPLLWTASQPRQAKASRVAASRWARGILKPLQLVQACHLLCCLAGDADVTAASLAQQGLGLATNDLLGPLASEKEILPDFASFVQLVFTAKETEPTMSTRVQYFPDFTGAGQANALSFGMHCLMADLYGGDDKSVAIYLKNLVNTLAFFHGANGMSSPALMDLLDVASGCFAITIGSSRHARELLVRGKIGFGMQELEELVFSAASSKARRYLAEAIGEMYNDGNVWGECQSMSEWLRQTNVVRSIEACCSETVQIQKNHFLLGKLHGALYLGAQLVRSIRMQVIALEPDFDDEMTWEKLCTILAMLAKGILQSDDVVGNAAADGLTVALSYTQQDAPVLHPRLSRVCNEILQAIAEGIKTFKDAGDASDIPRITKLVRAGEWWLMNECMLDQSTLPFETHSIFP